MKRTQDKIRRRDEEERVRYAQLREELKVERAETLRVLHEQIDRSYEQLNRRMKLKTSLMQLQRRSSDETNQLYDQVMALLLNRVSPVDGFNQNGTERLNKDLREEPRSRYPRFEQAAGGASAGTAGMSMVVASRGFSLSGSSTKPPGNSGSFIPSFVQTQSTSTKRSRSSVQCLPPSVNVSPMTTETLNLTKRSKKGV
ncbi:unnamed protein product [Aphanomyces euteiches]